MRIGLPISLIAVLASVLLAGCSTAPPRPVRIGPGRVCIIRMRDDSRHPGTGSQIADLLAGELSRLTTATEVVVAGAAVLQGDGETESFLRGRVPLDALVEARRRYGADAVLVGCVRRFHPYWKPSIGLQLKLIDTANGRVQWRLSCEWNAGNPAVQDEIERYCKANRGRDECRFGPDLFVVSPRYFLLFVANSAVRDMVRSL